MQLKSRVLIIASIFTLFALIAIQGYLIYNSYELKNKTFTIDARNAIAKVYNTKEVDSVMWLYRNHFLTRLESYRNNSISKKELINSLQTKASEINPNFLSFYHNGIEALIPGVDINLKIAVASINLTDSLGRKDIIFSDSDTPQLFLLGENFGVEDQLLINNSTWQKDHEFNANDTSEILDLNFKTSVYMNVVNQNSLLIKELSGLFVASSLLLLFVVSLLYYSIRNLIKQKRLSEIKTDFINNITHELKTPLSTLKLATNTFITAYEERKNSTIVKETVEIIERQNTRIQKLIDQVLKSSLGYQQIQISREHFNATVFLQELLKDYRIGMDQPISIVESIENTGVTLHADPFYLSTAIINILNNAAKYGGTELQVKYSIDAANNHLISISDNGIGISPKYQRLIFEKFYRVSEQNKHNYKGLGLGLYYTNQIIKAHQGSITVSSDGTKGSNFEIKIPVL